MIAAQPIARAWQAGGSLLVHPLHLGIVVLLLAFFAYGSLGLIIDQWPCFIGVPVCD